MGRLSHTDIIKRGLLNRTQAGATSPGTDAHLRIFAENPGINAVIHAHPPALTAFAVRGKSLESPELSALFGGAPLLRSSSPDAAAPYCKSHGAVLLAGFGLVTWGSELQEAYFRLESLEHHALILLYSGRISGEEKTVPPPAGEEILTALQPARIPVSEAGTSFPSISSPGNGCGCGCIPPACICPAGSPGASKVSDQTETGRTKEEIINDVVQNVIARFAAVR
jgi:hypothetical protein